MSRYRQSYSRRCRRNDRWRCVGVKSHFDAAQPDRLAVFEFVFLNRRAVDESSIGGTEVVNRNGTVVDDNLTMPAGNGCVGNFEVIGLAAAKVIRAVIELNFPSVRPAGIDHQSVHVRLVFTEI